MLSIQFYSDAELIAELEKRNYTVTTDDYGIEEMLDDIHNLRTLHRTIDPETFKQELEAFFRKTL